MPRLEHEHVEAADVDEHQPYTIWVLRNYGQQTVEMVGKYYERWGTTFEFYDSNGRVEPALLQRKQEKSSDTCFTPRRHAAL